MTYSKILSLISGLSQTVDYSLTSNALGISNLQLLGSTSGYIQFQAKPTTTSYTVVWPAAQAASSGYVLTNDGSGNLSWAAAASPLTFADSLVNTGGTVTLVNDSASPGATKYYGTNGSSVLGYYSFPASGITQLTGDVTAGPGSGSQVATLAATSNTTLTTLSGLTTASALATVGTITSGTWNGTTIAIAHGGTGQTTKQAAFDALSPLGTAGDTLYYNGTHNVNLGIGSTGQVLTVVSGEPAWATPATSGTVTSVSVASANGFAGTVATATTTPAITISTTLTTPVIAGNGTALIAATTTGTGSTVVLSTSPTLVTPNIGAATGSSLSVSGQLTSTVATGTAPLVVSSTTQVANLNAATAGTSINIAGGLSGSLPYQTAASTTALLGIGSTGNVLTVVGGLPAWAPPSTNGTVTSFAFTNQDNVTGTVTNSTTTPTLALAPTGTAPVASSFAAWDANKNLSANNHIGGYTTTATAAGTTTLVVGSTQTQFFTGTTTQTVLLPAVSTLATVASGTAQQFIITNNSTGVVTVQSSGGNTVLAQGAGVTAVYTCISNTGTTAASWNVSLQGAASAQAPTVQKFLSGSGTYTTPAGCLYIQVEMVGGGGGGWGSGTTTGTGGNGGNTTFGTSLLTAPGGPSNGSSGAPTVNSPAVALAAFAGGTSNGNGIGYAQYTDLNGSPGASSPFGGAGYAGAANSPGGAAVPNTGSGGGGGGINVASAAANSAGIGGGAGAYVKAIITNPSTTYSYSVGAGGTAGTGSTAAGGAGGSGVIIVTEYYGNVLASAMGGGAVTPTVTVLSSGSGTFATPSNALYIQVEMVGGGSGGAGSGLNGGGGTSGAGGNTTFGTSLLFAGGASAAVNNGAVGVGGTASLGTGPTGIALVGGSGAATGLNQSGTNVLQAGGQGGSNPFGGAGNGGTFNTVGSAGQSNTGAGGGGGAANNSPANIYPGNGGGSGGYVKAIITNPLTSYAYSVGTGGAGGAAGTDGFSGGAGGSGIIIVTTYYNNGAVGTATSITGSVNSSQVLGTTAGGNAPTGYIGEYISSSPGSNVSVTTSGNYVTITSISLTAGDWDVSGMIYSLPGTATGVNAVGVGISLTNNAADSITAVTYLAISGTNLIASPMRRINVSATTTVYLVGQLGYSTAGTAAFTTNSIIQARRVR